MNKGRVVSEQTHKLPMFHNLDEAKMKLPEKFQVMALVKKFPKSWEDFGMMLKHRKEKINIDDSLTNHCH